MKCSVKDCKDNAVYFGIEGNRFCRKHAVENHKIRDDLIMVITKPTKKHAFGGGEMQLIRISRCQSCGIEIPESWDLCEVCKAREGEPQ